MIAPITNWQADILAHAASNGRYVSAAPEVLQLAATGLIRDHGPQPLAAGDHYLTITGSGVAALREWREKQPVPPKPKRRSPAFDAWMTFREVYRPISFTIFLKSVWPNWEALKHHA